MRQQTSRSTAHKPGRPLLAPAWLILLLALGVVAGLVLMFGQRELSDRLQQTPQSPLSVAYLSTLLRSEPDNAALRLTLARQQAAIGQTAAARHTLQPLLAAADPGLQGEARWLLWQLDKADWLALPAQPADPRQAQQAALLEHLDELSRHPWPAQTKLLLAAQAFELGDIDLGLQLYLRLAEGHADPAQAAALFERAAQQALAHGRLEKATNVYLRLAEHHADPAQAAALFERAAQLALAHGRFELAADAYLRARQSTPDARLAREYFHAALRALQSGDQVVAALELGERELGDLADDRVTLLLLVELARAAGRPDRAEHHIRHLLKMAWLRQWQAEQLARAWGADGWQAVSTRTPATVGAPGIAFDDHLFNLGYSVFLENRNLEAAWQLAAAAVRQRPRDMVWRQRLAQVSEWTQRPELALEHWLLLAEQTQQDEAWQAVLRLAPGLFQDPALIPALRHQLGREPGNLRLLKELLDAYERVGEPQAALDLLARMGPALAPQALEWKAELAERAGQSALAIQTWERLFALESQLNAPRAIRAATLLMLQGRGAEGLRWLEQAQARVGRDTEAELEFWRFSGQLAVLQQQEAAAIRAYTVLLGTPQALATDYDTLLQLLAPTHPGEAARVATRAWERFAEPRHLLQALSLHSSAQQWAELGVLLRPIGHTPLLAQLRRDPVFLRLTGNYHLQRGELALARRDFEAGLQLAPQDVTLQEALLWLFINSDDAPALRGWLQRHETTWRTDAARHDGLAFAYQALSLPQVALQRYLTPRLAQHQTDFLWLMNYADALDQNQHSDRAWRLRRHLLSQEWHAVARAATTAQGAQQDWLSQADLSPTRRIARARLLLSQRPGDAARQTLRELLRLDRDAENKHSNPAAELAIGWLQERGEHQAQRAFLWHQYLRSRNNRANRPLWAEITVALVQDDRDEAAQLLDRFGESLPRHDRINAARRVGDLRRAQTDAFETQTQQTDDDPLHQQLSESLLAFSDHAGVGVLQRQLGSIDEQVTAAQGRLMLSPRLGFDYEIGRVQRHVRRPQDMRKVPDESFGRLQAHWQHQDGQTRVLLENRHATASYTPFQIEHEEPVSERLTLRLSLGTDLPSPETLMLRVAGKKDRVSFGLRQRLTRRDQIEFEYARERFQLQSGPALGRGSFTRLSWTHGLRQETPDLEFNAFWSRHRFDQRADPNQIRAEHASVAALLPLELTSLSATHFVPENFDLFGLRLSTQVRYQQQYTRAWRPFASLGLTHHSRQGLSYDLQLGLAGSVFGADHLSLRGALGKSGEQGGALTRELQLKYRLHY